jgi:transcriptional regulator with XRE-family HTH domain
MSIFSENLKFIRVQSGLNQTKLSSISKVSQAAISQLETGERTPTNAMLLKLSIALACDLHDLTGSDMGKIREHDIIADKIKKANPKQLDEINTIIDYVLSKKS